MYRRTEAAENHFGPYLWYLPPAVEVPMGIPVSQGAMMGLVAFGGRLEAATLQSKRLELLPPGFNEVQPAGVLGNELQLDLWPGQQSCLHIPTFVNDEIVFNEQPAVTGKGSQQLLQQLEMRGAITRRAAEDSRQTGGWFEGAVYPDNAAPPIVWLKGSPARAGLPRFSRVGFHRQRTQLVDADDARARRRLEIGPDYRPLFSTNSGSCLSASWNQLCCRFQSSPSACSHFQMVEGARRTPCRSSHSVCRRGNVHNSKGRPRLRGFCRARSMTWERTSSLWVAGRPARGLSASPAIPSALNRFTQCGPLARLLNPVWNPASVALSSGSSSIAWMSRARCTSPPGSVRDLLNRFISAISSVVNVLNAIRFLGMVPSH